MRRCTYSTVHISAVGLYVAIRHVVFATVVPFIDYHSLFYVARTDEVESEGGREVRSPYTVIVSSKDARLGPWLGTVCVKTD